MSKIEKEIHEFDGKKVVYGEAVTKGKITIIPIYPADDPEVNNATG